MVLTALSYDNGFPAKYIKKKSVRNALVTPKDLLRSYDLIYPLKIYM